MIRRRQALIGAAALPAALAAPALAQPAQPAVHALMVGIDNYRLEPLRGCVNDLRLLEPHVRQRAASVTTVIDRQGTRANFMRAWQEVTARCQPGDWFFLSFSGHGARKPEAHRGSEADNMDDFLVFWPFHPAEAPTEILLDNDMEVMLAELGRRQVEVLFLADCCHSGTLTRGVHPAAREQQRMRTLDGSFNLGTLVASLAAAPPPPRSPPPDQLRHVHLFAGSVEALPVPEVTHEGRKHGALSVAFSRVLAAGGTPPLRDLAEQVVRGVRAMGDGRQNADITLGADAARGLFGPARSAGTEAPSPTTLPTTTDTPIRLRVDGRPDQGAIARVERMSGVRRVQAPEEADLIWNPDTRQTVSALGDLLSNNIGAELIDASVARARAVRRFQALSLERPPELRIERHQPPTRGLTRSAIVQYHNAAHPAGTRLVLRAERLRHPHFLLFSLAGDGTVQFLYPEAGDPPQVNTARPFVVDDIIVKEPFGSDHVVAVVLDRPVAGLARELAALHERREPMAALAAVERAMAGGAWQLGLAGLFTRPG